MKRCPELKYLDMRSIKHQIFYFPEAKARLDSLCELKCDTSIDSSYFYGLSSLCQYIQSLIIINTDPKPNHGIVKFIEVQNNLKHFEWKDYFDDDILTEDPYEEVFCALEKKADSLNYLRIYFQYVDNIEETSLQKILPKLYKLKILTLNDYRLFTNEQLEQLRIQVYHDLEILSLEWNSFSVIPSMIENSGRCIKKILFKPENAIEYECNNFNEDSLNFIRKIYENCPSIEYLTITFPPSEEHFAEFEKLLKICQNIKSLLIIIYNVDKIETSEKILENGKILLEILVRSAPTNLKEIRFYEDFKFSLENLEDFLEKWRGRPAISILTSDPIYERENYEKLINKYQEYGVIKIFKHSLFVDEIDYHFYVYMKEVIIGSCRFSFID
ncbi:20530_t:CDS:1 [Rhizophagus irregularis]|nr:20530_t:CDS:1 [Rhizophagus irregularis]